MKIRKIGMFAAALLLSALTGFCQATDVTTAGDPPPALLPVLKQVPFARRFDFEDGTDPFVAWASNASYTVNFKGITEEQAFSGKRAFKLDMTFRSGSYVYWSIPIRAVAEGSLRLSASMRIGEGSAGRAGVGANIQCVPSAHSGCGSYLIENMETTRGQWLRRETDLVVQAKDVAAGIARKYVALADGDNVGAVVDRIGLFIGGKAGDRVVVFLDDIRLEGSVPAEPDYAKRVAARWVPVAIRRKEAFAKLRGDLTEIRQEVGKAAFHSPGARFLSERVSSRIPQWQAQLDAAQAERDLRPDTYQTLRDALESLKRTRDALREVDSRNLVFQGGILYALDNPIVNFQILPHDLVPPARVATDLRVTAAQGEIRASSLILQALRDLKEVTVSVSDLTHEQGGGIVLPSSVADVRVVKCWYQAGTAWHGIGQQKDRRVLTPELLVHDDRLLRVDEKSRKNFLRLSRPDGDVYWDTEDPDYEQERDFTVLPVDKFPVRDAAALQPTELSADTLKQYWLTFRIPDTAGPGTYTGTVTVAAADGVVGKTELRLSVLPFRLPMPMTAYDSRKAFTSSIYYRGILSAKHPQGSISSEYKSEGQLRAELKDMAEHGIFNPTSYQSLENLAHYLRVRDEAGMRGLPLYSVGVSIGNPSTEAQLSSLRQKIGKVRVIAEPFGIREVYLYGIDEARGEELLSQKKAWKLVREAGAKSFVAGYKGHFDVVGDLLDVQVQANVPSREDAAQWHSAGGKIFCYANPQTGPENPELFRRNYGFYLWLQNYERVLSERERVATRNYLLKKWFGKTEAELADLPEAPVAAAPTVRAIAPEAGERATVAADMTANFLQGEGTVDAGAETLTVRDLSDFTGTVDVGAGGTLALSGRLPAATPSLATAGRILHLDATEGLSTETNASTLAVTVKEWRSKLNDGWSAMPGPKYNNWSATNYPDVVLADLNGLDVVKMPKYRYFVFCKDGMTNRLENIQSVFWVIGSQEGGGFILGGGRRPGSTYVSEFVWHRGGSNAGASALTPEDPIFSGNPPADVYNSSVRLNGTSVNPRAVGLSGGYDVMSFVLKSGATVVPNADGLAFDGRIFVPEDYSGRMGNQRIAELIIYDRRLTDGEVAETEAYLQAKWGFSQKSSTNAAKVNLAAGATLDCSASSQYVGTLSGAGSVTGDLTAGMIVVDAAAETCVSVDGTFTVQAGLTVEIMNYRSLGRMPLRIKVLGAMSFAGLENLSSATVTGGGLPENVSLRVVDGALYVYFPMGTTILFK